MNPLKNWLYLLALTGIVWTPQSSNACTIFCVVRDGQVLFCNNEDFTKPGYIWFVPAGNGRYGRVNLGFEDRFVQGSMNDQGLAFDATALSAIPWKSDPNRETPRNLIEKIMNECATVEEALNCREPFAKSGTFPVDKPLRRNKSERRHALWLNS